MRIIGWSYNGALYHDGCQPCDEESPPCPIFAHEEIGPLDSCDRCVHDWIRAHPGTRCDLSVYLDESAAKRALNA